MISIPCYRIEQRPHSLTMSVNLSHQVLTKGFYLINLTSTNIILHKVKPYIKQSSN